MIFSLCEPSVAALDILGLVTDQSVQKMYLNIKKKSDSNNKTQIYLTSAMPHTNPLKNKIKDRQQIAEALDM